MKYLGLSWTATFLQLALRLSWGVIAVTFAYTLHLNSVEIGTVLFLFYAGYVASSIPWGTLIDKVGPNKVITLSAITSGVLLLPILLINNIFQLYAIYLAEGVLTAGLFPSSVKIVSSLERPLTPYLALLESAAPIVLLVIALASGIIINYWREFYVVLFIALIITGLSSHLVRVNARKGKNVRRVFNRDMAKVSLIRGGELWGTWGASSWLFPFLVLYDGIPKNESEVLFVLYAVGQVLSIIINNKISTRVRDLTLVRTSLIVFILSVILVSFLRYFSFLYGLSLLLGISSFLYRPPTDSVIVKMNKENAGTSMGLANAVSQVGSMTAPLIVGLLISLGDPTFAIASLSLGPLTSLILVSTIKSDENLDGKGTLS